MLDTRFRLPLVVTNDTFDSGTDEIRVFETLLYGAPNRVVEKVFMNTWVPFAAIYTTVREPSVARISDVCAFAATAAEKSSQEVEMPCVSRREYDIAINLLLDPIPEGSVNNP